MSFHHWLQNLRSSLARRRGQRHHGRRDSLRTATHRLHLEPLEDRCLLAFIGPVDYTVDTSPQAVATADFNNDGNLDLATANGTVSVLLGDGQGGFGAASHFAGGSYAQELAVGDFNNDGNLDVATIGGYQLSVLLGNGDGAFQPPVNIGLLDTTPGWLLSVAAADFNADGKMDLAVTAGDPIGSWPGGYEVLLGDGAGGFAVSDSDFEFGGHPRILAVAELNADGLPDLAVNVGSGTVLLSNGDGTLRWSYSTGGSVWAMAVGDFTGDGIPDLVTAAPGLTVDVLPGNGDGTFASPIPNNVNGVVQTAVSVADFNGDGKLDVITTGAGTVSVLLGRGDGTLTPPINHAAGSSLIAVAVGDFNGDDRPDAAAADSGSNAVSVLLNNGAWPDLNAPWLQIRDVTVTEGNTGTVAAVFTVTLSAASDQPVTVAYATASGTATAGSDYQTASGTLLIPAGQTTGTITVLVNGDRLGEPNEAFFVNLSSPTNATIADAQGVGTILDNEPRISISDVSKAEGKNGQTTLFSFTVTLSTAYDQAVTVNYATANGTATAGSDYLSKTGTVTFASGETTKTITVSVKGDKTKEADETFFVNLANASGARIDDGQGLGTILDDDGGALLLTLATDLATAAEHPGRRR
jgi:hypothetical protein